MTSQGESLGDFNMSEAWKADALEKNSFSPHQAYFDYTFGSKNRFT
jgi:hypothetical protein